MADKEGRGSNTSPPPTQLLFLGTVNNQEGGSNAISPPNTSTNSGSTTQRSTSSGSATNCWNTEALTGVGTQHKRGERRQNKTRVGWVPCETNHNSYFHVIGYETMFAFIGHMIQLFSLDKLSTIIHFGLTALYIFSVIFHKSRSALLVLLLHPLVTDR